MDKTFRISLTGLLATALVLVALLAAYLLGDAGGPAAEAAPADESTDTTAAPAVPPGRLTMGGVGQAVAVPDQLGFSLEVHATRPTLATALDDTGATLQRVLDRLGDLGVAKGDVQTSGLSMNPVYDYHQSGPPTLRGYRVSQRAQVLVTDLKKGGAAITTAVEVGDNTVRVEDIQLSVADPEAALAKARAKAVEAATAKAEEYAAATGQELGAVLTLREVAAPSSGREYWSQSLASTRAAYDAVEASVPIRSGKDDLSVRVEVVWALAG
jgi:uncharacterized protein YggE